MTWTVQDLLSGDTLRCEADELYSVDVVDSPLVYTVPHAGVLVPARRARLPNDYIDRS